MKNKMCVYISTELMEEVHKLSDMEESTIREVVETALRRFISRPSFSRREVGKTRKTIRVLLNMVADKMTIGDIEEWAYENNMTIAELNSMFRDACIFSGLPVIRIN